MVAKTGGEEAKEAHPSFTAIIIITTLTTIIIICIFIFVITTAT